MKVYLMNTNAESSLLINEDNKWYYLGYVINGCNIDISNFNHIIVPDGLDVCSLLDIINSGEIRQGDTQGDFIYDTDAIKGGEN